MSLIRNPSKTHTMIATLRRNDGHVERHRVPPEGRFAAIGLPVVGEIIWPLWTLEWEPPPRKGLMRFSR